MPRLHSGRKHCKELIAMSKMRMHAEDHCELLMSCFCLLCAFWHCKTVHFCSLVSHCDVASDQSSNTINQSINQTNKSIKQYNQSIKQTNQSSNSQMESINQTNQSYQYKKIDQINEAITSINQCLCMCIVVCVCVCACACGMFMLNVLCACIQMKHNKSIKSITANIQIQCNQCFARCWLARLFLFILLSVTLVLHLINQTINRCKQTSTTH